MIRAVLFDLDGVLIDSETFQHHLIQKTLEKTDIGIPAEAFFSLIGSHKSLDPWKEIFDQYNPALTREELHDLLFGEAFHQFRALNKKEVMFKEVPEVLKRLKESGFVLACASSSTMDYIQRSLKECGIIQYFDLIVTSDDFKRSKPAPDIYCFCLKKLNVAAKEALVIEDSPIGIEAAKAAGITVLARINPEIPLDQSQADGRIRGLDEIFSWIEEHKDE